MRQTIGDIARAARVSTATVDRVLNERQGYAALTRARVLEAARAIGYLPEHRAESRQTGRCAWTSSCRAVRTPSWTCWHRICWPSAPLAAAEVDVRVHRVDGFSAEALAASLREHAGDHWRHRASSPSTIPWCARRSSRSSAAGTPILTLVSDIAQAPRIAYVGIDNRNAGRLAGHLLGRFVPGSMGEVALFAGSLSYRGHEEREMGFRHILADDFPRLRIVELREVRDDLEHSYHEARSLLAARPGLRGIYNIGAGNRGIARALDEAGRGREVVFIGHELTQHTRGFLLSGTMDAAIDQNPRVEAREAIDRLLRAAHGLPGLEPAPIRIHAIFRENMPEA